MILKNVALVEAISVIKKWRAGRSLSPCFFYLKLAVLLFSFNGNLFAQPSISVVLPPWPYLNLCHSECLDVEFVIENGSGNYEINISPASLPFTVHNFQDGEVLHICNSGPEWPMYTYDDANRTLYFSPPNNLPLGCHFTIINFYDLILGQGIVINSQYVYEIQQNILPNTIPPQIICLPSSQSTAEFDLTSLETDIIPSEYPSYVISVSWFEDFALTIPIVNTTSFITSTTTVYASLSYFYPQPPIDQVCTSGPIPIELIVTHSPAIDNPILISDCHDIVLPPITGEDITAMATYYSGSNESGIEYSTGDIISDDITLFIHDGYPGCESEVSFDIDILPRLYLDPMPDVSECGSYQLPQITGINTTGNQKYYTEVNGMGVNYLPGEFINSSTTLYLFDPTFDADCVDNQPSFHINIMPNPQIYDHGDIQTCVSFILPPIDGINLSGQQGYFSSTEGNGTQYSTGDTIMITDTIYIYDQLGTCTVEQSFIITIGGSTLAGRDSISLYCTSSIDTINLFKYLHVADTSGLWLHLNGDTIIKSKKYPVNTLINDSLRYVVSHAQCGRDTALVVLKREAPPQAGSNATNKLCRMDTLIINLDVLIGNHDANGLWSGSIAVMDSSAMDLTNVNEGSYSFSYIVNGKACAHDTAVVSIGIVDFQSAGQDVNTAFCGNGIVDLSTLLVGQSLVSIFENPNGVSGLSGNLWNTTSLSPADYSFIHHVDNTGVCPDDEATINITLANALNAGDDVNKSLCYVPSIDLSSYLSNANSGGVFIENGQVVSSTTYFPQENASTTFLYVVGQGTSCPQDTAAITIKTLEAIDTSYVVAQSCDPAYAISIGSEVFDISHQSDEVVLLASTGCDSIVNVSLTFLQPQSGSFSYATCDSSYAINIGNEVFDIDHQVGDVVLTAASGCDSILSVALKFVSSYNTNFSKQTCDNNYTVTIGAEVFDINHQSGDVQLTASSGCDSIVHVALSFAPSYNSTFSKQTCDESYSINIGGELFDINHTTGTVTLLSSSGCDSIVNVALKFAPSYNTSFINQTCDDSYSIVLGGEVFDINHKSGDVVLSTSLGCDSIIHVSLNFVAAYNTNFNKQTCDLNYTITIGGELFDFNHTIGVVTLQSATGCDSIVNVALNFSPTFNTNFTNQTCDKSYAVTIGGEVFDINRKSGSVVLLTAKGCDSIVNVSLSFLDNQSSNYTYTTCDSSYTTNIGNEVFDIDHQVGEVVLLAVSGCDSVVSVALKFIPSYQATITEQSCDEEFSLTIGNTIFDINNPSGIINLQTSIGCDSVIKVDIEYNILPTLTLDQSTTQILILGDISSITDLSWTPSLGLSCDDCTNPLAHPNVNTQYILSYANDLGCNDTTSIYFLAKEKEIDIIFPNVIDPTSTSNQYFYIPRSGITILSMKIYDRWGSAVFSNQNFASGVPELGWNGSFNNQEITPGVYVYFVQVLIDGVVKDFVGDVTVVR